MGSVSGHIGYHLGISVKIANQHNFQSKCCTEISKPIFGGYFLYEVLINSRAPERDSRPSTVAIEIKQ